MTHLKVYNNNAYCRQHEAPAFGFADLLNEFPLRDFLTSKTGYRSPRVNIKEETTAFMIEMEVPGIDKNLLKMNLSKDLLTISYTNEEKSKDEKFTYREFNNQNFERAFRLPDSINKEMISASYQEGILLVNLPKKVESIDKGPRSIDIS